MTKLRAPHWDGFNPEPLADLYLRDADCGYRALALTDLDNNWDDNKRPFAIWNDRCECYAYANVKITGRTMIWSGRADDRQWSIRVKIVCDETEWSGEIVDTNASRSVDETERKIRRIFGS